MRCNCFYKGNIYECEVTDLTRSKGHLRCRIPQLDIEVDIMRYNVNWQRSPEVEERWLDEQEERNDRAARRAEVRRDARNAVRERANSKRRETNRLADAVGENRRSARVQSKPTTEVSEQVLQALRNRLDKLCGVGSRAVAHMLSSFHRSGDAHALLFRLVMEMERTHLYACQEKRAISIKHLLGKRKELCLQLVDRCRQMGIEYGYPDGNKDVVCLLIPDSEPIVLPVKEWGIVPGFVPAIAHEWDGKHRMNIRRIEDAISRRYGCWLRWKYPERFSTSA